MMNLYRQNRPNRGRRRLVAATLLLLILFAGDILSGGQVRRVARVVYTQVWGAGSALGDTVLQSGFFSSRRALKAENDALRAQFTQLRSSAASVALLEAENASLRALVNLAEREGGLTAPIISSTYGSPYGTFLVGAGSRDGVKEGDLIATAASDPIGFVVGQIEEVGERVSLVRELFAPGNSLEGTLNGVRVVLSGRGSGNARTEVPRELQVTEGDLVRSPSLGGFVIGVVGEISDEPSAAETDVYVGLPVALSSLPFVYVIQLP